jgi:hypothetical protein
MELKKTKVCIDCDEVWSGGNTCPKCGRDNWVWLQAWIKPISRGWTPEVIPRRRGHEVTL